MFSWGRVLDIRLTKGFARRLNKDFDKYDFEVGILRDGPHYLPKKADPFFTGDDASMGANITSFAGGPIRKRSSEKSDKNVSDVAAIMAEKIGENYLREPFVGNKNNKDLKEFLKNFFRYRFGKSTIKRLENSIQAVVRNPILRQDYGPNSPGAEAVKGFNRFGFDTGQWFQSIRAKVTKRNRR